MVCFFSPSRPNYSLKVIYFPIITPLKHPHPEKALNLALFLPCHFTLPECTHPLKSRCGPPLIIAQYIYIE